ncbi:CCA tRNA nucleotidyltransferase [Halanaerobium salsuginis]|uniref:Poly(A) polymerase n=1 Tax=Halanaerobium salsuginis TaxID=29563 RepID=A0A1I4FC44_9FIRM|nr:CCA tRNA nucleotidyltransferase [Halanaerobium salsuginis]SFL15454.1 poly(A) polymerase [Halanaerobium salsuginis]
MENKISLVKKIINTRAEEYYEFDAVDFKIINLNEVEFKKIVAGLNSAELTYYQANVFLQTKTGQIYFNKQNPNLLADKIKFLRGIRNGLYLIKQTKLANNSLKISLEKGLDLLKKYQSSGHDQASFLQYQTNLLEKLSAAKRELLLKLAAEAAGLGYNLYLVGGQVRDMLINLPLNKDLDILLEGDLQQFFSHLAAKYGYQYDYNSKFSTGFLHNQSGFSIDIASCREEKYHFPGALPLVEKADLFSDLYRRDFTVNCLVIDLHPDRKGILYDFFGGLNDLQNGLLQVLHDYSFRDDPLRILRGIRFQILKDFQLSAETVNLSRISLKKYNYKELALERIFTELSYLFNVKKNIAQFSSLLLNQIPVLQLIESNYKLEKQQDAAFLKGEKLLEISRENGLTINHFLVRIMILFYNIKESRLKRWPLSKQEKQIFAAQKWLDISVDYLESQTAVDPALNFRFLEKFKAEELIMAGLKNFTQSFIELIFTHLNKRAELNLPVSGSDLLELGLAEGPAIKEYLLKVRDEMLRKQINGRQEAINYLKKII